MNPQFLSRMQNLLPDEMETFLASLERPQTRGIRLNPKKPVPLPKLSAAPFAQDLYYLNQAPGLMPEWFTGSVYFQEPSAAAPVDILGIQPDDFVLDLCAAPGSKSTQIAGRLETGFLLANELDPRRARILQSNLERQGFANVVVTNGDAISLCEEVSGTFDKVLVDAPCSGEGMMKKHAEAKDDWSLDNIYLCAARQEAILHAAQNALKPGGILVYSTCTYAPEENEEQVRKFLEAHPHMEQLPIEKNYGRPGIGQPMSRRIFPMDGGEGHFIAKFRKREGTACPLKSKREVRLSKTEAAFLKDVSFSHYIREKDGLHGMNVPFPDLKTRILSQGILIGQDTKGRFEPAHAFYLSEAMKDTPDRVELDRDLLDRYLHGQQLSLPAPKGYVAVCWNGLPAGFAKSTGTALNNRYPKGLRLQEGSHLNET